MCLSINALLLIREVNSLTARLDSIEQQNKDLMNITHKLMHITESLKTEITQCKERVKEPELTTNARAFLNTSHQCTSDTEGTLLFTSATHHHSLKVCSNSQWIDSYKSPPKGSPANVAYSCRRVAANFNVSDRNNGSYYVYINWIPVRVRNVYFILTHGRLDYCCPLIYCSHVNFAIYINW
jgi:hypothetical protein